MVGARVTSIDSQVLERQIRIGATPETLFDLWIDPEQIVRWMGRSATLEPRPGGIFRIDYNGSDVVRGEFVEVDRPSRLVLTWGWEAGGDTVPPGASTVEVTFSPDGDGTILTVRHLGLPTDSIEGHGQGWDYFLPRLVEAASA